MLIGFEVDKHIAKLAKKLNQILAKIISGSSHSAPGQDGVRLTLDGNTAITITEASIGEIAGLHANQPDGRADRVWQTEQQRFGANVFGNPLVSVKAVNARGALTGAIGAAITGKRTTAFISATDLANSIDLMANAANQLLPLVIHVENGSIANYAGSQCGSHLGYQLCLDIGCFVLFAPNAQAAADMTLIARRTTELTLVPGIVVIDTEETAIPVQDVSLLSWQAIYKYLGVPGAAIAAPNQAQNLLFGDSRPRVPNWFDVDRPVLVGGMQNRQRMALGVAAREAYYCSFVEQTLQESCTLFTEVTNRNYAQISTHKIEDAQLLLIVAGAMIETAEAVADFLRSEKKLKVGVLGVLALRPFPGIQIANCLNNKQQAFVLERSSTPLTQDPPLLREIRVALARSTENHSSGNDSGHSAKVQSTKLRSVIYGIGGIPAYAEDLIALCTQYSQHDTETIYLGFLFTRTDSSYPQRQALLDSLQRDYPELGKRGLKGKYPGSDVRPAGSLTIAILQSHGDNKELLLAQSASFLHQLQGGAIRGRQTSASTPWSGACLSYFTYHPGKLRDPGDNPPIDLLFVAKSCHRQKLPCHINLKQGALVVIETEPSAFTATLPPTLVQLLKDNALQGYTTTSQTDINQANTTPHAHDLEYLLGSICATMVTHKLVDISANQALHARDKMLTDLTEDENAARLAAFQTGFNGIASLDAAMLSIQSDKHANIPVDVPISVRKLKTEDNHYDSLSRFWNQTGILYQNGDEDELVADPYMATNTTPPLLAALHSKAAKRGQLAIANTELCSGCGTCWSQCPHGALTPLIVGARTLLDSGIDITNTSVVRQISSKLAARINQLATVKNNEYSNFGDYLTDAFSWLQEKLTLPEERLTAMQQAIEQLVTVLGSIPVTITNPFFHEPESKSKGSGEFLIVAVNPEGCTACGLCCHACEADARSLPTQHQDQLNSQRQLWQVLEQLPNTRQPTQELAASHEHVGAMPSLFLERHGLLSFTGGDSAEAGSGERLALRLVLAIQESQSKAHIKQFCSHVAGLQDGIEQVIRKTLAHAVNAHNLEAIAAGLKEQDGKPFNVAELVQRTKDTDAANPIDRDHLQQLVELAQSLKDLYWRLTTGTHGTGRAGFSLVIASGTISRWAATFSHNPFLAPVCADSTGNAAAIAAGIVAAQVQKSCHDITLLRKAHQAIDGPIEQRDWIAMERITWQDLTKEEQQFCPPLLLIGSEDAIGGNDLAQNMALLATDLPLKIVVLAHLELGLARYEDTNNIAHSPDSSANWHTDLGMMALAHRSAIVVQTAINATEHLFDTVGKTLSVTRPALIRIYTPCPVSHGFASNQTIAQSKLAVQSRLLPLYHYDPAGGKSIAQQINLDGNPDNNADWVTDTTGQTLTPVHWAVRQKRFAHCFAVLDESLKDTVDIAAYTNMDAQSRRKKIPVVTIANENEQPVHYRLDRAIAELAHATLHRWRILQEMASVVTTDVEGPIRSTIKAEHDKEIAALKADFAVQMQQLKTDLKADIEYQYAGQIQQVLLEIAGYQNDNVKQ